MILRAIVPALLFLAFSACKRDAGPDFAQAIDSAQHQKDLSQVARELDQALVDHPDMDGGRWYGQLAKKSVSMGRSRDAEIFYLRAIRDHHGSEHTPENLAGLSELYRVYLNYDMASQAICCALKERGARDKDGKECCPDTFKDTDMALLGLREKVFDATSGRIDAQQARHYIALCQVRALLEPEDPRCADHLNEAAKVAKAIRAFPLSFELYDWIITDYGKTPIGAKAMFLKAFTLENDLQDLDAARVAYEEFLKSWPKDDFADDARLLLENLGKDPEELIRQFQQQSTQ